jgi:PAS domain-containing protein
MTDNTKSLWELLWDYDPNGLVVLDREMRIRAINGAFCQMFRCDRDTAIGREAAEILGDISDFQQVLDTDTVIKAKEICYLEYELCVRKVIFPIRAEGIVACIMVDLSHEFQRRQELQRLKQETLEKVHQVVDRHMQVAQEIAGLLGETTAETKVSLLKLQQVLDQEIPA